MKSSAVELNAREFSAGSCNGDSTGNSLAALEKYAQVLLLANEFAFVD